MKQVQDHYFRQAKKEGYPARSVYKLDEAQKKHRFLKKGGRILDIGCSPGSWSMYAARVAGTSGLVVGVDLTRVNAANKKPGAAISWLKGDITSEQTLDEIRSACKKFSVVLSDMAPKTTGNKFADQQRSLDLSRKALEVALELLEPGGTFYCKVFEGEDFKEFFDEVRASFKKAKIIKPKSSRSESREVFVLGMGLKNNN